MRSIVVIPARLSATRFPEKVLADLCGKPVLWHVWRRATLAAEVSDVIVATDDHRVAHLVDAWGGKAVMTCPQCRSGSERIASLLPQLKAEFVLNVQADEPLIDPNLLDQLIAAAKGRDWDVITPIFRLRESRSLVDSNVVKVVRSNDGRALYFSRSPLPHVQDLPPEEWIGREDFWGNIGVYGYRRDVLAAYARLPAGRLETAEKLDLLRLLEAGFQIGTIVAQHPGIGIDAPDDLERARRLLLSGAWSASSAINLAEATSLAKERKDWGTVEHLSLDPELQVDRIQVVRGGCCSLHYHQWKDNRFLVLQGALRIEQFTAGSRREDIVTSGAGIVTIPAGTPHRFVGVADETTALELYSPVPGREVHARDIIRLRPGGLYIKDSDESPAPGRQPLHVRPLADIDLVSAAAGLVSGTRGVILFNRGEKLLVRLVACLHSLRKWWKGPVAVFLEGPHPECFLRLLRQYDVDIRHSTNEAAGAYIRKVEICLETPYDRSLFLDSDTQVVGPIEDIFAALDRHEVVTPHYADWWSSGKLMRKRIGEYRGKCPDEWIAEAWVRRPAVNMGVFAFRRGCSFLVPWLELARQGDHKQVTLPEEIAFQILYPRFDVGIIDRKFNVSVNHDPGTSDPRIIHYHGQKHVLDLPLCAFWKATFAELEASNDQDFQDLLHRSDRRLRRHCGVHKDVTIVTACDPLYVDKLRVTFPTWVHHKRVHWHSTIVFVHGMPVDDARLDFLQRDFITLIPWDLAVSSQRERMLSAFVFGVARHVQTRYWLKIDADAYATDDRPLVTDDMKRHTLFGHRWGRSVKEYIEQLDAWAAAHPQLGTPPLLPHGKVVGNKFLHPRTQSFVQLEETTFTRYAAELALDRLPVPSQDTFICYLADRLGKRIGRGDFKKDHGWNHCGRLSKLKERIGA